MQASGNCRQIPQPFSYVLRAFLKNLSAFVLCEGPPRGGLANRDQGSASCWRATECRLICQKLVFLQSNQVALVACGSTEEPLRAFGHLWYGPGNGVQPLNIGKGLAGDGAHIHNSPWTDLTAYEGKEPGIHFGGRLLNAASRPPKAVGRNSWLSSNLDILDTE